MASSFSQIKRTVGVCTLPTLKAVFSPFLALGNKFFRCRSSVTKGEQLNPTNQSACDRASASS